MNFNFLIIWTGIVRQLCGLSLSYLIALMLSPKPNQSIPWYRPTIYMRAMLSLRFWVPIAVLSYSMYVSHVYMIGLNSRLVVPYPKEFDPKQQKDLPVTECPWTFGEALGKLGILWICSFIMTIIFSIVVYMMCEKPGIDSRVIFKNKLQIIMEKQELSEQIPYETLNKTNEKSSVQLKAVQDRNDLIT